MKKILLVIVALCTLVFGGDYEEGIKAIKNNDTVKGILLLKKAAKEGNVKAQVTVGLLYSMTQKDSEALEYYQMAAEQGDSTALFRLALLYREGKGGLNQDNKKAAELYLKAAEKGNRLAQYNLAEMYLNGWGVVRDDKKAFQWYLKAAENGFASAQHNVAVFYLRGIGVNKDDKKAVYWLRKAIQQGDIESQKTLVSLCKARPDSCKL